MFNSLEQAKRFMDAGQMAEGMLTPVERDLYEAGCQLRDELGFGREGNSDKREEEILDEVNRSYPGFDAVIDKWIRWHQGFMFGGSDSGN